MGAGLLALRQGDLSRALPLLEQAVSICQEAAFLFTVPLMAASLDTAYTLAGRVADAIPLLTQAREQNMTMSIVGEQALWSLPLSEAQRRAGRLEEGRPGAEHTLALTRAHKERGHEAYALHLLGDIAMHCDSPGLVHAEAHYHQALTLADALGMRPLQAHCHHGLGTLYGQLGQREQARTALSTAIEMYRAMEMTFWLPQAEAVLAQVEGQ